MVLIHYPAKGRNYYEEDIFLSGILKDYFDIVLCNPKNSLSFEKDVDLIINVLIQMQLVEH